MTVAWAELLVWLNTFLWSVALPGTVFLLTGSLGFAPLALFAAVGYLHWGEVRAARYAGSGKDGWLYWLVAPLLVLCGCLPALSNLLALFNLLGSALR